MIQKKEIVAVKKKKNGSVSGGDFEKLNERSDFDVKMNREMVLCIFEQPTTLG